METDTLEAIQLGIRMFQAGLALLANPLTMISVVKYRYLHTPSNVLVACLALSDFLHGLIMLVSYPLRTVSRVLCVVSITIESCTIWAQFMTFSLLAIERRCSLLTQLNRSEKWSLRKVLILQVSGWVAIVGCHVYFAVNSVEVAKEALCTISGHFIKAFGYVSIAFFVLTTVTIAVFYGAIAKIAHSSRRKVGPNDPTMAQQLQKRKADLRITRMMGLVVGMFFALYLPVAVAVPLMVPSPPLWHHILEHIAINIFDVNFWINPIIYAWRNKHFRKAFKNILPCYRPDYPTYGGNVAVGMNNSPAATGSAYNLGSSRNTNPSHLVASSSRLPLEPRRDIFIVRPCSSQSHILSG